jgi:hypothetical protein
VANLAEEKVQPLVVFAVVSAIREPARLQHRVTQDALEHGRQELLQPAAADAGSAGRDDDVAL